MVVRAYSIFCDPPFAVNMPAAEAVVDAERANEQRGEQWQRKRIYWLHGVGWCSATTVLQGRGFLDCWRNPSSDQVVRASGNEVREACERDHQFESAHRYGLVRFGFWTVERSLALELVEASDVAGVLEILTCRRATVLCTSRL